MRAASRAFRLALVAFGVLAPSLVFAQDTVPLALPVSIENVRKGLDREPSPFEVLPRQPDFRIRVEALVRPLDVGVYRPGRPFDAPVPFGIYAYEQMQAASPTGTPPIAGFDVLSVVRSLGGVISRSSRARRERDAKETVQSAMREFCAAQPDGGARLPACAPPSIP
jgi:hypothetical protein